VNTFSKVTLALTLTLSAIAQNPAAVTNSYTAKPLVSDIPGVGVSTDKLLVNPWGLSKLVSPSFSEEQWWASDNGTGVSTLYNANGTKVNGFVVTIPPASGTGTGSPTGTVGYNQNFAFSTADGTISLWKSTTGPAPASFVHSQATAICGQCHTSRATITVNNSSKGAAYTGLTEGSSAAVNGGRATLYAANAAGGVEAYDGTTFAPVTLAQGAFVDANVPANFTPYGIQAFGPLVFVTFAPAPPTAGGAVDLFSAAGALLLRLQSGSWFSQPFGVAIAPANFGAFSGDILVGNTGSGTITAFDPKSGNFLGFVRNSGGAEITIPGLWGISFGNGSTESGPTNTLYYNAGIGDYKFGLFGALTSND
jgi:uncharacterized protein (TIGR03118 family)